VETFSAPLFIVWTDRVKRQRSEPKYLAIAQVLAPHGVAGEVRAAILTEFPERFALLDRVYLGDDGTAVGLEHHRFHKGQVLLKLEGYDNREQAEALRQALVQIPTEEAMPLPEGQYYIHQIVGLDVWTDEGEHLGRVEEVLETGANDVYLVRDEEGNTILIPAIHDAVLEIDLEESRMLVHLMPGLR
jgi:16S rRNA processing protein RimM